MKLVSSADVVAKVVERGWSFNTPPVSGATFAVTVLRLRARNNITTGLATRTATRRAMERLGCRSRSRYVKLYPAYYPKEVSAGVQ